MGYFDRVESESPHLVVYSEELDEDVREYFEESGLPDSSPVSEKAEEAGAEKNPVK